MIMPRPAPPPRRNSRLRRAAAGLVACALAALATVPGAAGASPAMCHGLAEGAASLGATLPRTGAALRAGQPLTVLLMGGGTDRPAGGGGFAGRLETALELALPGQEVRVQAIGAAGQLAKEAAERLRRTVAESPPTLVVWRTGVGDALAMTDPEKLMATLRKAAEWLAAHGVELVLVDPAWHAGSPQEETYRRYAEAVAEVGRQRDVAVFPRYGIMRGWTGSLASASPPEKEACLARLLAASILRAAGEPVPATVAGPR